ncbi:MAG: cellulase family glycosylhydrolase [Chitinophagaceae bacterium]|nr:cellulase family glycosylhydrolase [Chitinophagaceae bacterium]
MTRAALIAVVIICLISCKKNNSADNDPGDNYKTDTGYRAPLSKGINLSNWFNDYSDHGQFSNRFTDEHFALLKQLGFTYVRIPIGQYILYNEGNPSQLNAANLQYVDKAVENAIAHGLAVTINYHPASNDVEKKLPVSTESQDKMAEYWKAVAKFFKKYGEKEIFFEVFNEPHVASDGTIAYDKTWWNPVQLKLIKAIRSETPGHFIIVGGESWNSIDGLRLLTIYKQNNIVYNFHFYDPFVFTHQGATWAGPSMAKLRNVPYPSSPENVAPILDTATDQEVIDMVGWYGQERWDKEKLAVNIQRAVDWATANRAALICNEFGSYMEFAPRESRLNLIRDIREILEENNIGWAMWEMDEGFGFINYSNGDRSSFTTDNEVLHSLGLK